MILGTLVHALPTPWRTRLRAKYRRWRDWWALLRAMAYDHRMYAAGSGLFRADRHPPSVEASLIKAYHRVEKGLALRDPRPGFGKDAVETVLQCISQLLRSGQVPLEAARACRALDEYVRFNKQVGADIGWMESRLSALRHQLPQGLTDQQGGTIAVTRDSIHAASRLDLRPFFASRYSVRQFAAQDVDSALVLRAVEMAQKAPSVCNRQCAMVYAVYDPTKMQSLLQLQNGNRGFGEQAGCLLLVTARLDTLLSVGERYQGWIDGGLFAMSLIYALHSLGLGSCCLNWSVEPEADRALKQRAGIASDQQIIMLIAVGHLPDQLTVAQSPRRPIEQVLKTL